MREDAVGMSRGGEEPDNLEFRRGAVEGVNINRVRRGIRGWGGGRARGE